MATFISSLVLNNYRNFIQRKFDFNSDKILLCGDNGVGKTNCLEAISFLGRSQSLRGDDFDEVINCTQQSSDCTIFAELNNNEYIDNIALKYNKITKKKIYEFNGDVHNSKRQSDLKNHLINFIILTPQIEQLFISGKSNRRDYLDKIVSDIDLTHQSRINDYQKLLKERLLILQKYNLQKTADKWLDIVENKIAEIGIAIAFARIEALDFFNKAITSFISDFPKALLRVNGEVEDKILSGSALKLEEFYRQKLRENRSADCQNFKTEFGVHRADFEAIFVNKKISATQSSTGEQKAIMISISLARAKISAQYKNLPTIFLCDEVVSHLDDNRKLAFFDEVAQSKLQYFFTATNLQLIPSSKHQNLQVITF